jgi:hypothetical protein
MSLLPTNKRQPKLRGNELIVEEVTMLFRHWCTWALKLQQEKSLHLMTLREVQMLFILLAAGTLPGGSFCFEFYTGPSRS